METRIIEQAIKHLEDNIEIIIKNKNNNRYVLEKLNIINSLADELKHYYKNKRD